MSNKQAWVTLATNDSYALGALVLAHSLRRVSSVYPSVVIVTPAVTDNMRGRLNAAFGEVVTVDVLDSRDAAHLALLARPELGVTFTKIHCWSLTQYDKCVFLDADTLIVQNCDELFEREELSAAPDVGWPDCFNSGVFVYRPSAATFDALLEFARERGSFDGGDQGLLNSYFSSWAHGDISKHLPFLYNVTSAAFYSYLPALQHFGADLKIIHFIGTAKPWLQRYNWESGAVDTTGHLEPTLQLWWDIFVQDVHPQLDDTMVEQESFDPGLEPHTARYVVPEDPDSQYPWHRPEPAPTAEDDHQRYIEQCLAEFHDPWEHYRGNQPPNEEPSDTSDTHGTQVQARVELHHRVDVDWTSYKNTTRDIEPPHSYRDEPSSRCDEHNPSHSPVYWEQSHHTHSQVPIDTASYQQFHETQASVDESNSRCTAPEEPASEPHAAVCNGDVGSEYDSAESETECCREEVRPRHPYDNYYLLHQSVVDTRGRKRCSHEPTTPPPSPPLSPPPDQPPQVNGDEAGLAGTLARLTLGAAAQQQAALDEHTRRQGWEAGNIDYLGADSFANIWAKISQTLAQPKARTPPREPAVPSAAASTANPPAVASEPPPPAAPVVAESECSVPAVVPVPVPVDTSAPAPVDPPSPAPVSTPVPAPVESPLPAPVATPAPAPGPAAAAAAPAVVTAPAVPSVPTPAPAVPEATPTTETKPVSAPPAVAAPAAVPRAEPTRAADSAPDSPAAATAAAPVVEQPTVAKAATPTSAVDSSRSPAPAASSPKVALGPAPPATPPSAASLPGSTDSPPLVSTPEKDAVSPKSAEEVKGDTTASEGGQIENRKAPPKDKLYCQLKPSVETAPLLTPDSELEDAATIAQSIITSELTPATPSVISATPPVLVATPKLAQNQKQLSVDEQVPVTPPVSLAQIGILPAKPEPSTARAEAQQKTTKANDQHGTASEEETVKDDSAPLASQPAPADIPKAPEHVKQVERVKVAESAEITKLAETSLSGEPKNISDPGKVAEVIISVPVKTDKSGKTDQQTKEAETSKLSTKTEEPAKVAEATKPSESVSTSDKKIEAAIDKDVTATSVADKTPSKIESAVKTPVKTSPGNVSSKAQKKDETAPLPISGEAPVEPPKKRIVKKVVKKESSESAASAGETASPPVPPPRKKVQKPKEK